MKLTIFCLAAVAAVSVGGCAENGGDQAAAAMTEAATPPEDAAQNMAGGMSDRNAERADEPTY